MDGRFHRWFAICRNIHYKKWEINGWKLKWPEQNHPRWFELIYLGHGDMWCFRACAESNSVDKSNNKLYGVVHIFPKRYPYYINRECVLSLWANRQKQWYNIIYFHSKSRDPMRSIYAAYMLPKMRNRLQVWEIFINWITQIDVFFDHLWRPLCTILVPVLPSRHVDLGIQEYREPVLCTEDVMVAP